MSIPHFEDLNLDHFLDAIRLEWTVYEKFDGSYFEFGLTDGNEFFSRRKGGQQCRLVTDWEMAHWTNGYRQAHAAAQQFIDLLRLHDLIQPGQFIGAEMIFENQTNTIRYDRDLVLCVTQWHDHDTFYKGVDLARHFRASVTSTVIHSNDGIDLVEEQVTTVWSLHFAQPKSKTEVYVSLSNKFGESEDLFYRWLNSKSGYLDYSVEDILRANLSIKNKNLTSMEWLQHKQLVNDYRTRFRLQLANMKHIFSNYVIEHYMNGLVSEIGQGPWIEGLVIRTNTGLIFKIVNKTSFRTANAFTHKVKYFLVGGQRPARNSFVRRTTGWQVDQRVDLLDSILEKYIENHDKRVQSVNIGNSRTVVISYTDTLHLRTLNLFADLRRRIQDGRYGF